VLWTSPPFADNGMAGRAEASIPTRGEFFSHCLAELDGRIRSTSRFSICSSDQIRTSERLQLHQLRQRQAPAVAEVTGRLASDRKV